MSEHLEDLEAALNWPFRDSALLQQAVTHSTYANEHPEAGPDNERLEFLGDAVLDLVAAKILFADHATAAEGEMSRLRSRVVRQAGLARLADELELGLHLKLGTGQSRSGNTPSILADAYEAVAGAVFLDGGYAAVEKCFEPRLQRAIDEANKVVDFKTALQELCHTRGLPQPKYRVVGVEGPAHDPLHTCALTVGENLNYVGTGNSKKQAEQSCARQLTEYLCPAESESETKIDHDQDI